MPFTGKDSVHICSKFRYNICCGLEITTIWTKQYIFLSEPVTEQNIQGYWKSLFTV